MMKLTRCRRCGAETVTREGIKGGEPAILEYDSDTAKLHRLSCVKRIPDRTAEVMASAFFLFETDEPA